MPSTAPFRSHAGRGPEAASGSAAPSSRARRQTRAETHAPRGLRSPSSRGGSSLYGCKPLTGAEGDNAQKDLEQIPSHVQPKRRLLPAAGRRLYAVQAAPPESAPLARRSTTSDALVSSPVGALRPICAARAPSSSPDLKAPGAGSDAHTRRAEAAAAASGHRNRDTAPLVDRGVSCPPGRVTLRPPAAQLDRVQRAERPGPLGHLYARGRPRPDPAGHELARERPGVVAGRQEARVRRRCRAAARM